MHVVETGLAPSRWHALAVPAVFLPSVGAARAALVEAYERLGADPRDPTARAAVHAGRAALMHAIINEMR